MGAIEITILNMIGSLFVRISEQPIPVMILGFLSIPLLGFVFFILGNMIVCMIGNLKNQIVKLWQEYTAE